MKKKLCVCGTILAIATVFFVLELSRDSQNDSFIEHNQPIEMNSESLDMRSSL